MGTEPNTSINAKSTINTLAMLVILKLIKNVLSITFIQYNLNPSVISTYADKDS